MPAFLQKDCNVKPGRRHAQNKISLSKTYSTIGKKLTWKTGGLYDSISYIDGIFEYRTDGTYKQNLLHIMDNRSRIAMIRIGDNFGDGTPNIQYNLEDNLGSSVVLLKDNGANINKEEYYPFGETSFGSYAAKRYRYVGKEKDAESGLYYYGARYYSAWTCRFISVDPLAAKFAQLSPYNYADNNPINDYDIDGMQSTDTTSSPQSQPQSTPGFSESKPALLNEVTVTATLNINIKPTSTGTQNNNLLSVATGGVTPVPQNNAPAQTKVKNNPKDAKPIYDGHQTFTLVPVNTVSLTTTSATPTRTATPQAVNRNEPAPMPANPAAGQNNQVLTNEEWQTQAPDWTGCFRACQRILREHGINNPAPRNLAIQMTRENTARNGLDVSPTFQQGLNAINQSLDNGEPIIVGVNHTFGNNYNEGTTDHFIIIVGRGEENGRVFYRFFDVGTTRRNAGTHEQNRLYLLQNNTLSGVTQYNHTRYVVSQVRPNPN